MDKKIALLAVSIGSLIGGYVPSIFGAGPFSLWGIVMGTVGGIAGLWVYKRYA